MGSPLPPVYHGQVGLESRVSLWEWTEENQAGSLGHDPPSTEGCRAGEAVLWSDPQALTATRLAGGQEVHSQPSPQA